MYYTLLIIKRSFYTFIYFEMCTGSDVLGLLKVTHWLLHDDFFDFSSILRISKLKSMHILPGSRKGEVNEFATYTVIHRVVEVTTR